ncbi:DGQHR domain-containing protein [Nocardia sp. NPDC020380]|uniref:DGQHR domain-containing protein n=1 Tax=Nocardia sp. NPDC020380 TaxID=3364309 RepID=UPI0037BBE2BD
MHSDVYDQDQGCGYQRAPITARIKGIAEYYRGSDDGNAPGRMPNPLLLNIRDVDYASGEVLVTPSRDGAGFKKALAEGGDWIGTGVVEFGREVVLWIYDGQHRMEGVRRLLKSDYSTFAYFPIPVSITINLADRDERFEFYQINTNAKSVRTDIALRLLQDMAKEDPVTQMKLLEKGKDWVVRGQEIAEILGVTDGPWEGRFTAVNQRRSKNDPAVIQAAQFARSLKPVLEMGMFKDTDVDTLATVLNAYWTAVSRVLPAAFNSPQGYVLQRGTGVAVMHHVLPQVIEVVRSSHQRLGDPDSYVEVLKDIDQLQGQVVKDGQTDIVEGSEFWKVGSAVSAFSGDAGRRRLTHVIETLLPSPNATLTI